MAGARNMIRVSILIPIALVAAGLAGCSTLDTSPASADQQAYAVSSICEPLGVLTARVDCDCYDKMSYDKVRFDAKENLHVQARTSYPESNRVEISSVDLYMNSAVAKGTAYRCPVVGSN
jgi:hypothetical protein